MKETVDKWGIANVIKFTYSYMQWANSRKNETLERSMNEGDLREGIIHTLYKLIIL